MTTPPPRPGPSTTLYPSPAGGPGGSGWADPAGRALVPPRPPGRWDGALRRTWEAGRAELPVWALIAVGLAGVLGGVLVIGHRPGLGLALVELAVWVPPAVLILRRRAWLDLAFAVGGLALLATVAVRDAGWVVGVATVTGIAAVLVAVTGARSAAAVLLAPFATAVGALRTGPLAARLARRAVGERRAALVRALRSALVTVILVVVFGALFAGADALFAAYLPRVDVGSLPGRVVLGLLVAGAALTAAHLAAAPVHWPDAADRRRPARLPDWLAPIVALDVLVVAFLAVQAKGLLAGHGYVMATTGLTYADYARAGFGQLVVVTALTLVVVGVAARRAPRGSRRERLATSVALGVLGVGTLGVVASALRRMVLYVDAYGLTRLRLLVLVAEVVLGVVLVLVMAAGIRWRGAWLPRAAAAAVVVGVGVLVAINPDATIARYDLAADAPLDEYYLAGLSADATPVLAGLDDPQRSWVLGCAVAPDDTDWASWNLGRSRAEDALATVRSGGGTGCASTGS
ncbi:DUF4173 domain-containing protein [Actinotalea sp. M2MS4P-6]|uniref:DUF4153 domain-containing protein n=1 Tax=Actinotalea sp. M2MS4P-6 TaxID=2983762 RepID=UPI0021E459FF|nr:DUF4173 domain-containing protein [Actinotalea sp. M2MS4P-6]MCV2394940.1 DUF4173 domain-containing protein [Actinotalea sp. M2MS4P-6]